MPKEKIDPQRTVTVNGKELENFIYDRRKNILIDKMARRVHYLYYSQESDGQKVFKEDSIKRRLQRWFNSKNVTIKIEQLEELFAVCAISLSDYNFSEEDRKKIDERYRDEVCGHWHIYARVAYKHIDDIKEQELIIWPSKIAGQYNCYCKRWESKFKKKDVNFTGTGTKFNNHMMLSLERVDEERNKDIVTFTFALPLAMAPDTIVSGINVFVSLNYSLRSRFFIASQKEIANPEEEFNKSLENCMYNKTTGIFYNNKYEIETGI